MFKSINGLKINTLDELKKKSIHCDRSGKIENGQKFVVESLAYYDILDILGYREGIERKFDVERRKARNLVKLYFACEDPAFNEEEKLISSTLELAMKKGLVA